MWNFEIAESTPVRRSVATWSMESVEGSAALRLCSRPSVPVVLLNMALALCAAGAVLLTAGKYITFGAGSGGWVYRYISDFQLHSLILGIGIAVAAVILLHISLRRVERHEAAVLILWVVLGTAGQLALHSLYPYTIADVVTSWGANTFFTVSHQFHGYELLSRFHALSATLPLHVKANMPGKLLFYQAARCITEDPRTLGILILALSNLGAVVLYFIVKQFYRDPRVALSALALYLFIPAKIYFLPLLNIVSAVPVLIGLLLWMRFLATRRPLYAATLGIVLYGTILFDPEPLALGLFFIAAVVPRWRAKEVNLGAVVTGAAAALAGFAAAYAIVLVLFHFDLALGFRDVVADSREFNLWARPYAVWLWADLLELGLNAGIAASVLCVVYLITLLAAPTARRKAQARSDANPLFLQPGPVMLATLLAIVAVLDLVGVNRGEVTRLWICLMIFVQVAAAGFAWETGGAATVEVVLAGSIIQTAVTISMVGFIILR